MPESDASLDVYAKSGPDSLGAQTEKQLYEWLTLQHTIVRTGAERMGAAHVKDARIRIPLIEAEMMRRRVNG